MNVNEVTVSLTLKVEQVPALCAFLMNAEMPVPERVEPAPAKPKKRVAKKASKKAAAKSADTKEARHVEAAAETAPAPEPAPEPADDGVTLDDIRGVVRRLIHLKRSSRVAAVLEEFGASKLPELKKASYSAALERLKQEAEA